MADYDRYDTEEGGTGFMMGLLAGTILGAGLGMLLMTKTGHCSHRAGDSGRFH